MNYWLLKSEGTTYSIDDLKRDGKTPWTGIRNYQARNFMRDGMKVGDLCLFYHTGDEKGVFGICKVASTAYPDPTQFVKGNYSYDPKSTKENPIWMLVDIAFVKKLKNPVMLSEMKIDPVLRNMKLLHAPRLSVQPVTEKEFKHIEKLAA